ncbi:hypothetical protein LJC01_02175 [Clostridiaceae bacterium OttesenSCG-928-D20]|nr:hypothetical protein [Clostridiaceae bacterium OttesenSCG-928-D20]
MKVSFEGIGELVATFYNNGASDGDPVKPTDNGEVSPCAAGDKFIGVAAAPGAQYTGVIIRGFAVLPYTGAAPALGMTALSANGSGGVKADDSGCVYPVVAVDKGEKTVCIIL